MTIKQLTYRDVLTCKTWLGHIERMYKYAIDLGYEYFLWNDRVYRVEGALGAEPEVWDTGLGVKDVM